MSYQIKDRRAGYQREGDELIGYFCECGARILHGGRDPEFVHVGECPIEEARVSEFKSDYYEYSIEWAWEYEEWAEARIAKLQAVVDAAKVVLRLPLIDGTERWVAEQALEQAIEEVE